MVDGSQFDMRLAYLLLARECLLSLVISVEVLRKPSSAYFKLLFVRSIMHAAGLLLGATHFFHVHVVAISCQEALNRI